MSKTVIDEFVVSLGLDPGNFGKEMNAADARVDESKKRVKGLGDEIDSTSKKREKSGKDAREDAKKTAESYSSITKEIFKLTGAFIGLSAIKSAVVEITKADASLGRLSRNLSLKPEDLKAFEGVAEKYGSSAADMDAAFTHITKVVAGLRTGVPPSPEFLLGMGRLGINQADFFSRTTDDLERFKMIQDALSSSIKSGRFNRAEALQLGGMMGLSPETLTMMLETSGHLKDLITLQKSLNETTGEDSKLAQARTEAWKNTTSSVEGTARALLEGVTPAMLIVLDATTQIAKGWKLIFSLIPDATEALSDELTHILGSTDTPNTPGGYAQKFNNALGWVIGIPGLGDRLAGGTTNPRSAVSGKTGSALGPLAIIAAKESKYNLPSGMLRGVYGAESSSGSDLRPSRTGALGPFQHMPAFSRQYGEKNPLDFNESADVTARALRELLDRFHGNIAKALAGYNSDPSKVEQRFASGTLPAETRQYIPRVRAYMPGYSSSTSTSEVNIGNVTINANNANAAEVARLLSHDEVGRLAANNSANLGSR